jgi:hypothetical protein
MLPSSQQQDAAFKSTTRCCLQVNNKMLPSSQQQDAAFKSTTDLNRPAELS